MAQKDTQPFTLVYLLQTFNNTLKQLGIEFSELKSMHILNLKENS